MKQYLALSILLIALTFAVSSIIIDDSYGKYKNLQAAVESQKEFNRELDVKVKNLQDKVFALKNDPRTIEEKAREEGMARPNELIFMFE